MLDINRIRKEPEKVIELLSRRNKDFSSDIKKIIDLDGQWRNNLTKAEELKQERNTVSKEVGILKREGKDASEIISKMGEVSDKITKLDNDTKELKNNLDSILYMIPNTPDETVEKQDKVIKENSEKKTFDFQPRPHWEIGETLNIIDFKTAAKLSGSRFAMLKGEGAELERALISFMLDVHKEKHGYLEIMPPLLVREETMVGTGQLPKFREDMYITEEDNLCLIPTGEVPLANLHSGEMLKKEDLPKKYTAYTPCFRREAGSYGRDVSGLIRQHQFNKVELVNIVKAEKSEEFHQQLLVESEEILKQLGLTYRVLELGTEDFGFSAVKTYDLEAWMPGENMWREVSSCSNCRDFQARRMMTRYKTGEGKKEYVHTLNSSGLAVGRIFAAILENFQTEQINVEIPAVLKKYMNGKELIQRNK
jgi:seryl-tRNA synthetase